MTDYDAGLGGGAVLRLSVSTASQDIANNTSTLSWSLTLYKGSFSSYSYDPVPWSVSIAGAGYSGGFTFDFTVSSSVLIAVGSTVVGHAADGTLAAYVTGYIGATGTSTGGPASNGGYYYPATIPRASTPTFEKVSAPGVLITSCDAGLAIKINMNRASTSFTHKIEYSIGSTGWQTIAASGVGASYASWTIPLSLLNQIPNAASGSISIRVTTYTNSGATLIGSTTTPLTMTAGAAIVPDFGTITRSEATTVPNVATLIGGYVQGISKLAVAITSPAGIYGSTIVAQKIEVVGQAGNQITNASATPLSGTLPAVLTASGTVTIRGTVTDSRGKTYSEDVTVTVLAYSLPNLVAPITVQRALSGGTVDENGTYIRTNINASVQSLVVSAVQKNALTYRISTSPKGANTWTVKQTTTPGGLTFNSHATVGTYLVSDSFDVKVEVYDKLAAVAVLLVIATSAVPFHMGADGVGINKYNEGLADLEVAGTIMANGEFVLTEGDLADSAETLAMSATDLAVTPAGLAALVAAVMQSVANRAINGNFRINQRGRASAATLQVGEYGHDRWALAGRKNLCTNPSFETNTTGWTSLNGTFSRVSTWSQNGSWSASLAATASDSFISFAETALPSGMRPGRTYTVSASFRQSGVLGGTVHARARRIWVSIVGGALNGTEYQSTQKANVAAAERLSLTFTIPEDASAVYVRFYNGHSTGTMWFDSVLIEECPYLLPYFDGSTGGGANWSGTSHGSIARSRASSSYSFTQADAGQLVTLSSGCELRQTIETADMPAGTYTLAWAGTATGRVYQWDDAGSPPAYAASPVQITTDGTTEVVVEFTASGGSRTLGDVRLVPGTAAVPFTPRPLGEELERCRRYFRAFRAGMVFVLNPYFGIGLSGGHQNFPGLYPLTPPMRGAPSVRRNDNSEFGTHLFQYIRNDAGSPGTANLRMQGDATDRVMGLFSSTDNGGGSLGGVYSSGSNVNPVWLDAEF